jgi:cytochrome d ubiquinol oxidase subunit II
VSTDEGSLGPFEAWLHPFPLLCGVIALAVCAFLTPFYMLARPLATLREDFRQMALIASLALGAVTTLALPVAAWDAPDFFDRLMRALPLVCIAAAVALGLCSLVVLWKELHRLCAPVAAATVVAVIAAWGAALYPYILLPGLTIEEAAAGESVLRAFLITLPIGAAILVPSLLLLFSLFATAKPEDVEAP